MEHRKYWGISFKQRNNNSSPTFFVFLAYAKDIKKWAGVKEVDSYSDGIQRLLRPARVKAITRFLTASPCNTIPNNILVAFNNEVSFFEMPIDNDEYSNSFALSAGYIDFTFDENALPENKAALIVDGQHRLNGICEHSENIPLLIVSMLDASHTEQAFQFIVINNKTVKVPTTNVKSIIANIEEEQLQHRLMAAGVNYGKDSHLLKDVNELAESPFRNLLDWSFNQSGKKLIPITAVEQVIKYINGVFSLLEKEDDEESVLQILFAMWQSVKNAYTEDWENDDTSKLHKKVVICALSEYFTDTLNTSWQLGIVDIYSADDVITTCSKLINKIPVHFWRSNWKIQIQDNANVRKLIREDIAQIIQNSKTNSFWNKDLKLVDNN